MKNRDIIGEIVMVIVIVSILLSFMVIYSSNVDRMVFKYTESYQEAPDQTVMFE